MSDSFESGDSESSAVRLRSFVERLEHLQGEIDALNADKSEVFKEAKGVGFDVPALRVILRERKDPTKASEVSVWADLYRRALAGSLVHVHTREAA